LQFLQIITTDALLFLEDFILEYRWLIPQNLNLADFMVSIIVLDWSDHRIFYNMPTMPWIGILFCFTAL